MGISSSWVLSPGRAHTRRFAALAVLNQASVASPPPGNLHSHQVLIRDGGKTKRNKPPQPPLQLTTGFYLQQVEEKNYLFLFLPAVAAQEVPYERGCSVPVDQAPTFLNARSASPPAICLFVTVLLTKIRLYAFRQNRRESLPKEVSEPVDSQNKNGLFRGDKVLEKN